MISMNSHSTWLNLLRAMYWREMRYWVYGMETVAPLLSPKPLVRAFQSAGPAGLTSKHSISVEANVSGQKQMPATSAPLIDR